MQLLLANAGLPMIGVQMDLMIAALLPVVAAEALVFRVKFPHSFSRSFLASLLVNAVSTFVGIPMTWFALVLAELVTGNGQAWGLETPLDRIAAVTLQAPWLIPYEGELYWMVPAASLVLLFPFFVTSAILETWILRLLWSELPRRRIALAVWSANCLSYALLIGYAGFRLYRAVNDRA